ncbi:MAG: gamma-glutamyltransferase [Acidobacteriota bacterium]
MNLLNRVACGLLLAVFSLPYVIGDEMTVYGRRGMVVTAHQLASQVGMRVLMNGGNAVDATVSIAAVLGVVEFEMSGPGGVGNMLIYWNEGSDPGVINLDFRDVIASKARIEMYDQKSKERGILASCVPGNVAGWHAALSRYGTISWEEALRPAIEYAENGFPISSREASYIERNLETIRQYPTSAAVYLPGGRPPQPGEIFVQKNLARTLRRIAKHGPDLFYKGELADEFVSFSDKQGGVFTKADFENYQVHWREPAQTSYRDYQVVSASAPNFGPAIIETFNILEGFDLPSMKPGSADFIHSIAESLKVAADDGMRYIGDPRFVEMPLDRLTSKEYARDVRSRIHPDRASYRVGEPLTDDNNNTTAISVVDSNGNVVSAIQTLISAMGSRVVYGDTGVLFNNNMRKVRSSGPNKLEPGKTFGTPSAPSMVLHNNKPFLAIGGVGAANIWQAIVVVMARVMDGEMDLHEAIASPRFTIRYGYMAVKKGLARDEGFQYRELTVEPGLPAEIRAELEARGHELVEGYTGNVHAILIDPETGVMKGVGDPRIHARTLAW